MTNPTPSALVSPASSRGSRSVSSAWMARASADQVARSHRSAGSGAGLARRGVPTGTGRRPAPAPQASGRRAGWPGATTPPPAAPRAAGRRAPAAGAARSAARRALPADDGHLPRPVPRLGGREPAGGLARLPCGRAGGRPGGSRRRRAELPRGHHARQRHPGGALGDAEQLARPDEDARREAGRLDAEQRRRHHRSGRHGLALDRHWLTFYLRVSRTCNTAYAGAHDGHRRRDGQDATAATAMAAGAVPAGRRPPTDRLTASGKPVPEIRTDLRRIDDLPQRRQRAADARPARGHDRRRGLARQPGGVGRRVPAHGAGARPLRHPRPRGRPQAAVHQQALERLRRAVAPGLPGARAVRRLPPLALRPPPRGVRAERARHEPVRRVPGHPGVVPAQAAARRGEGQRVEEPAGPAPGGAQPLGAGPVALRILAGQLSCSCR